MTDTDPKMLMERYQDELPEAVRAKFEIGQQKYDDAWLDYGSEYHFRRMKEEFYEFRQAVEHARDEDEALAELADVVNFGLMYMAQEANK